MKYFNSEQLSSDGIDYRFSYQRTLSYHMYYWYYSCLFSLSHDYQTYFKIQNMLSKQ